MATISPASNLSVATAQNATAGAADALPQNDATKLQTEFLTLLVTQIQHQDPLNPEDPTQFTSQLAQFSSLEQLVGIKQSVDNQSKTQATTIGATAASFIGKTAEVLSDKTQLQSGVAGAIHFNQAAGSTSTKINLYDSSNRLVRTVNLGPEGAGSHDFQWDGLTDSGSTATDGTYRVEVKAADAGGTDIPTEVTTSGRITSVKFINGAALLEVNGGDYTLADLISLTEPAAAATTTEAPQAPAANPSNPSLIRKLLNL